MASESTQHAQRHLWHLMLHVVPTTHLNMLDWCGSLVRPLKAIYDSPTVAAAYAAAAQTMLTEAAEWDRKALAATEARAAAAGSSRDPPKVSLAQVGSSRAPATPTDALAFLTPRAPSTPLGPPPQALGAVPHTPLGPAPATPDAAFVARTHSSSGGGATVDGPTRTVIDLSPARQPAFRELVDDGLLGVLDMDVEERTAPADSSGAQSEVDMEAKNGDPDDGDM